MPEIHGHRGARALRPENTLPGLAHALAIGVWTVNDTDRMVELIEFGGDGIVTDRPDLLRQDLADRGAPLPCPVGHDARWSMSAVGRRLGGKVAAARSGIGSRPRRCASSVVLLAAAIGGLRKTVRRLCRVLAQCRTMTGFELVTAADVQLMQGLAQRPTAARPDLAGAGASYGELAWIRGQGSMSRKGGGTS